MPRPKGYFDRTPKITSHGQGEGWRYVSFHGINALGAANGLVTAQELCLAHYAKACE